MSLATHRKDSSDIQAGVDGPPDPPHGHGLVTTRPDGPGYSLARPVRSEWERMRREPVLPAMTRNGERIEHRTHSAAAPNARLSTHALETSRCPRLSIGTRTGAARYPTTATYGEGAFG
jgi:hypothetical protein